MTILTMIAADVQSRNANRCNARYARSRRNSPVINLPPRRSSKNGQALIVARHPRNPLLHRLGPVPSQCERHVSR
jgi:hypothetical protein